MDTLLAEIVFVKDEKTHKEVGIFKLVASMAGHYAHFTTSIYLNHSFVSSKLNPDLLSLSIVLRSSSTSFILNLRFDVSCRVLRFMVSLSFCGI